MARMGTTDLQRFLNHFLKARKIKIAPILVNGDFNYQTANRLRFFQHSHNSFNGERILTESGCLDDDTHQAIIWWDLVLPRGK